MDQVHRSEWVEWLDGLRTAGTIDVSPPMPYLDPSAAFRLIGAQYVSPDDTIELVLDGGSTVVQITLESPTAIWVDGEGTDRQVVIFDCEAGPVAVGWCGRRAGRRPRPVISPAA